MPTRPPLADTLPFAADFVIEVLAASSRAPFGQLSWVEINRLAARWLRPTEGETDTSRLGHAVVIEMSAHGLLDVEMTTASDGRLMVQCVAHPRFAGVQAARALAA
ncbi:hypothetical protein [Rubrivirga sp.]|uniref:hypothetical protein n=1 Tax=Rubrivirga sp. TaxID=1885344 RepID=UPI003B51AA12